MSIFKITLTPIITERDYEVKYVNAGRVPKTCSVCARKIPIGDSATTFMKRTSSGLKTIYDNKYTCGQRESPCSKQLARKLKVDLP